MDAAQQEIAALERLVGPQGTSPLFARLADLYLQAGRPQDALRVCDAGLANFPFYTTGHFVKGRTLLALEMTNEARRELEYVRDWLPTNPTIWQYLDSLPYDESQSLTLEPDSTGDVVVEAAGPEAEAPAIAPAEQNFFSALTDATPPEAAADTEPSSAPVAETNVFGLPSEAPSGFGGFGGFTSAPAETPAAEPESPMAAFGGLDGFGGSTETSAETVTAAPEEPTASYEETVTSALGEGAPGFVAAEAGEPFEVYAERLRLELGPTGIITLDQFLDGEGIVPSAPFAPETEPVVESPTPAASFDMPAAEPSFDQASALTVEASPEAVDAPAATNDLDFGGFPAITADPETPAAPAVEATPTGGLDLSGFPTAEEPATPAANAESASTDDGSGFAGPSFEGPPPTASDTSIEGLTAKLQSAKKITPVIDFSSKLSSDDDSGTMASSSFVTPTLAEIYAKQGWFDDAIKAYRTLAKTKPAEREKYEERIKELEEEKKKQA